MKYLTMIVTFLFLSVVFCTGQVKAETATAHLFDTEGNKVGMSTLTETSQGVLIKTELWNLPSGSHAFHIHAVGECQPPFKSAGGHYNPFGKNHGIMNPGGKHAGDLPNVYVGADGKLTFEVLATNVTLDKGKGTLFDADGSAIVMHAEPDDYRSDPAGNAGPRIACGVIKK